MELLERYLQAVRFWLPKAHQPDIIAELSEDLQSQIEDKEIELARPLNDQELEVILKRCGHPIVVASRFQSQQYLIGPALFPIYKFVLKMVLLWILAPVFLCIIAPVNLVNTGGNWGIAAARTLGDLWTGGFIAAGVITLVFAAIDKTQVQLGLANKWDPRSLPPVLQPEQRISYRKTICELGFAVISLLWVLLVPTYPVLLLGPAAAFLKPSPLWHTFYIPAVVLVAASVIRAWIGLVKPQWTWFLPLTQLLNIGFTLLLLHFVMDAAVHSSSLGSGAFVVLADPAAASAHLIHVTAIVNASIFISMPATWLGLCIAAVIHTWRFLRQVRKRPPRSGLPALLRML
jgi:hypothetical protein